MSFFGTLFWGVIFYFLWVPAALIYRTFAGRRVSVGQEPKRLSYWRQRPHKTFGSMLRTR